MFRVVVLLSFVCLIPAQLHAEDEALAIVEKAIAVHSGKDGKIDKLRVAIITQKGISSTPAGELATTRKIMVEWPKKARYEWLLTRGDGDVRMLIVVDGDSGWQKISGMPTADATPEDLDVFHGDIHALWVSSIFPLKEKRFTFSTLPEATINGNAAVGVKAVYRGRPDVALYFDKSTGLLARTTFKGKEAGVFVVKECTYSDYKEFGGLMLASKQVETVDRRKAFEWKSTTYEFTDKLPKDLFAKP